MISKNVYKRLWDNRRDLQTLVRKANLYDTLVNKIKETPLSPLVIFQSTYMTKWNGYALL